MSDFSDTLKDNLLIKLNRILHCHDDVTCKDCNASAKVVFPEAGGPNATIKV